MKRIIGMLRLQPGEGRTILFLMGYLTVICFGTSIGIALSTSLLLNQVGATKLPFIFVGISLVSILVSAFYTRWVQRLGSCRFYSRFLLSACGFLLLCNMVVRTDLTIASVNPGVFLQYLAFFVFLGLDIMHFSTYCQGYLNPLQRRRLYPLILSATKFGGILGGLSIAPLIEGFGTNNLLLVWALVYPAAALILRFYESGTKQISREKRGGQKTTQSLLSTLNDGFLELVRNPFVFWFAIAIFLDVFGGSLMVYQFNEGLIEDFSFGGKSAELSTFLGRFTAIGNGIALLLQIFAAPVLIRRFGVTFCHYIYPALTIPLLLLCVFSWNLPLVAILMFHKDYFFSVLHQPNRSLFYNGIEPEKRPLFVGFLDGVWTYLAHFCVGILLVLVVEWGPTLWPASGGKFAQVFSLVGVLIACSSLFVARKLQIQYRKTLLSLVAQKDLQQLISRFTLKDQEVSKFLEAGVKPIEIADWLPPGDRALYHQLFTNMDRKSRLDVILSRPIEAWDFLFSAHEFDSVNSIPEIEDPSQLNSDDWRELLVTRSKKTEEFQPLLEFLVLQRRSDLLGDLEGVLQKSSRSCQEAILRVFLFFRHRMDAQNIEYFFDRIGQMSQGAQKHFLELVGYSSQRQFLSKISSLFESRSQALRAQAMKAAVKLIEEGENKESLLKIYSSRKWTPTAVECWYGIFDSLGHRWKKVVSEMKQSQVEILVLRCASLSVLKNSRREATMLYTAIEEDLRSRVKLLLTFFSDEYDSKSLAILERALTNPASERKYEAMELLQGSRNVEMSRLLAPFLETQNYAQILEQISDGNQNSITVREIFEDSLVGDDSWIRACALREAGKDKMFEFRDLIEKYSKETRDLYSQEMAVYCLQLWDSGEDGGIVC